MYYIIYLYFDFVSYFSSGVSVSALSHAFVFVNTFIGLLLYHQAGWLANHGSLLYFISEVESWVSMTVSLFYS